MSCGAPLPGHEIAIVDPVTGADCPGRRVGELWTRGPSVSTGYWGRRSEDTDTFGTRRADDGSAEPWLRTGDLGFVAEGEFFFTGRLKDLIVVHGRNIYPQDIESVAERSHPAIRPGCSAAFAVESPSGPRAAVVCEFQEAPGHDPDAVLGAVRAAIAREGGIALERVVLIRPGSMPKTPSGKIRRQSCRQALETDALPVVAGYRRASPRVGFPALSRQTVPVATLTAMLAELVAEHLGVESGAIDPDAPLAGLALDSVVVVGLTADLADLLDLPLEPALLYEQPTLAELARELARLRSRRDPAESPAAAPDDPLPIVEEDAMEPAVAGGAQLSAPKQALLAELLARADRARSSEPIAIVGMACRFPGATGPAAYWDLLKDGRSAITEVPADRWNSDVFFDPTPSQPGRMYTRWGGFLPDVDQFDPQFFGISPREASYMDPQQRLLLEITWEALEDAGLPPSRLAGTPTGVFVGMTNEDYSSLVPNDDPTVIDPYSGTGVAFSIAAGRISSVLGLQGPTMTVDTACSSSLVALHLACQSLRSGESDLGIAGGVNMILSPRVTIYFCQVGAMSATGQCRTFDAAADGYVRSEGCGMVVLKRLADARRDGDRILALVRGSAVNHDGQSGGLTVPSGTAQQAVIRRALEAAAVAPAELSYIEAHGTGTPLGDPIEVRALDAVFGPGRPADRPLRLGSVKTNIGHLEAAAGIAGLIKVILALRHRLIPPHLNLERLNPQIRLDRMQAEIPTAPLAVAGPPGGGGELVRDQRHQRACGPERSAGGRAPRRHDR